MNAVTKTEVQEVAQAPAQPDNLLSVIQKVATDDRFDVEKMKALLEMRAAEEDRVRRMDREDREEAAKREWLSAFSKVQSEIGPIIKRKENKHTSSNYADLADIERIVTPILTKHGFSTSCKPMPCELQGHIRMQLTIGHEGGHEKTYEDDFPLDAAGSGGKVNKTPIQAKGSTQTYGRRYLKASALDLAFMDDNDGNGQQRKPAPRDPWTHTITSEMPDDATPRDKAEAIADALCAQFKRMNGERQLSNEWDRRAHLIQGEKGFERKHPDLWERVIDAYENRRNELTEGA